MRLTHPHKESKMQLHTVDVEPMTLQEYFEQGKFYFSESQQEAYEIHRMPYPYVVNAVRKLVKDYGEEFTGTTLYQALIRKACPGFNQIVNLLSSGIKVGYWLGAPDSRKRRTVRGNAIKAANFLNLVLKFEHDEKSDIFWFWAEDVPPITFRER